MRKSHKFILACGCMIGAGFLITGIGYAAGGRVYGVGINSAGIWVNTPNIDNMRISYVEETMELEDFHSMDIQIDYGTLTIEPSDHYGIAYGKSSTSELSIDVVNGCLTVGERPVKSLQWNNGFNNSFVLVGMGSSNPWLKEEYITLYLPEDSKLEDIRILNESGDVNSNSLSSNTLDLTAEYGKVTLRNISCADASITLESGDLELTAFSDGNLTLSNEYGNSVLKDIHAKDFVATMESGNFSADSISTNNITVKQAYGQVSFENASAANETSITNESGDIELTGFSTASLLVNSDYGELKGSAVSADTGSLSLESGDCKIKDFTGKDLTVESQFGNVDIGLTASLNQYLLDLTTDYGEINLNREKMGEKYKTLDSPSLKNKITVNCESGNITLSEK